MRKINLLLLLAVTLTMTFSGCKKDDLQVDATTDSTPTDSAVVQKNDNSVTSSSDTVSETNVISSVYLQEEYEESSGGNADAYVQIEITVSDNKYFYDNHEITFDEIRELLKDADKNTNVVLYDELASNSSFEQLTDYLDEKEILYSIE